MNELTPVRGATDERIQTGRELERCPFPVPFGWYCIDHADSVAVGQIRNIHILDQEWVMFRGEDGKVGITDPYCPHLGAHLGQGGVVEGNTIKCPFHHWQFDAEGWCRHIPYGRVMPGIARRKPVLRALPVQEKYGMIWAWYHPDEAPPSFDLPTVPELEAPEAHVPVRHGCWEIGTCLQEIGENGVDNAHLKFLHRSPIIPPVVARPDGHKFHEDIGGGYIVVEANGPGISVVRHTKDGVSVLMFSTSTPVTRELTRTRMIFTFKNYPEGTPERALAEHVYQHSIGDADGEESAGFESVDMIVWNNKKYRPKPLLCDGDGPIMMWREWFSQFYAVPNARELVGLQGG